MAFDVGQDGGDFASVVVAINNWLSLFDLLHRDTVHSLLTLGKPVLIENDLSLM